MERPAPGAESARYIRQYLGLGAGLSRSAPEDNATGSGEQGFRYIRRVGLGVGPMALRPLHELQLGDGRLRGGDEDGGSRQGERGGEKAEQRQRKVADRTEVGGGAAGGSGGGGQGAAKGGG